MGTGLSDTQQAGGKVRAARDWLLHADGREVASVTLCGGSSLLGGCSGYTVVRCNVARVTSAWEMSLDQVEDR